MGPKRKSDQGLAGKIDSLREYDKLIVHFRTPDDRKLMDVQAFEVYTLNTLQRRCSPKVPSALLMREITDPERLEIYWYGDDKYKVQGKTHLTEISIFARVEKGNCHKDLLCYVTKIQNLQSQQVFCVTKICVLMSQRFLIYFSSV